MFFRCSVRVVKSRRAGVGKSLYKKRMVAELCKLVHNVPRRKSSNITIPLHEKTINIDSVMDSLLKEILPPRCQEPRLFHIDISHEVCMFIVFFPQSTPLTTSPKPLTCKYLLYDCKNVLCMALSPSLFFCRQNGFHAISRSWQILLNFVHNKLWHWLNWLSSCAFWKVNLNSTGQQFHQYQPPLTSNHWTQQIQYLPMEMQVMAWDRHKCLAVPNRLMGS